MFFDGKDDPISWFFQNLSQPLFSHADVLTLAGERLTSDTLQNWANRKYVEPKIVGRERRYNPLEVVQISLAQPLSWNLDVTAGAATFIAFKAVLTFMQKLESKEFSLKEVPNMLGIVYHEADDAIFIDARKEVSKLFESGEAFLVLPFGRFLNDLAKRQRELVESRPVRKAG